MTGPPVVLITGCSAGGIGAAMAASFYAKGCVVYATARRTEAMTDLPASVNKLRLDVCNNASINAVVQQIIQEQGRIDILVNNAGGGLAGPVGEIDLEAAKQVYATNVWGLLAVTQAVVPHMAEKRHGKIVNIGSIVGEICTPLGGIYCSSKAAVHSLTDALRIELKPFGVQVMLVLPGAIRSNFSNNVPSLDTSKYKVYAQFVPQIEKRSKASQTPKSTPPHVFAEKVVTQVLKNKVPRRFWFGHMARMFKLFTWAPSWLLDRLLAKRFGLNRPAAPLHLKAA